MIYLDVSYIARLYFEDPGWEKVRDLAAQDAIACSIHGYAEVIAAIHRKFREKVLTQSEYGTVLRQFQLDCDEGAFAWLPLSSSVSTRVKDRYERLPQAIFLRASDAIHLACAAENNFRQIYSNDGHLLAAAQYFGVRGLNVI